jgi:peptide/nickel transport system permease protein
MAQAGPQHLSFHRLRWWLPAGTLSLLVVGAVTAPLWTPQDPYALATVRLIDFNRAPLWLADPAAAPPAPDPATHRASPFPLFVLGADGQGRDVLSAVCYGLRVSLLVGVGGTVLAMLVGVALGLAAGWRDGWLSSAIMRLADIQLSFPSVLIALFVMAVWGQGVGKIVIAVAAAHWVIYARVVRGALLAEREKEYVAAVRALGAATPRILLRHILPNLATPILVISAVEFASVVMLEALLSFLGLGVPITRPSLGMLIKIGYEDFFGGAWWVWLFPGVALVALVFSLNWLADLLREKYLMAGEG